MWVRRLKSLGAGERELLSVLQAQVLIVLQFASPAWSTQITSQENKQIESVLKTSLYLVYGARYESFSWALAEANMSSLMTQRSTQFMKFTQCSIKNPKFSKWFVKNEDNTTMNTRQQKPRFKPIPFRTKAYAQSAIPQMIKVANSMHSANPMTKVTLNSREVIIV